ncbi:MAG: hypothetical protein KDJ65_29455 [Anaerolineae bacterium]|nr:hypothetical protein [Anaerolineae bacterium]
METNGTIREAETVYINDSGAAVINGNTITIKDGGAMMIKGNTISVRDGGAGVMSAQSLSLRESGSGIVFADQVDVQDGWVGVAIANRFNGEAALPLDFKTAFIVGIAVGAVIGMLWALLLRSKRSKTASTLQTGALPDAAVAQL